MCLFTGQRSTHNGVHGLECSLSRFEPVVNFVLPWSHFHNVNKFRFLYSLKVEQREQDIEMIPNELRLVACSGIESGQ